jgi:hypothetical protein
MIVDFLGCYKIRRYVKVKEKNVPRFFIFLFKCRLLYQICGSKTHRYFMRSLAKAILASSNANRTPRQERGPEPKGIQAIGCLFFFNSGSNL